MGFKWQGSLHQSLDLMKNPFVLWVPLKISSLSGYPVNGLEKLTQAVNVSIKSEEASQAMDLCPHDGPLYV